ncbi:dimethylsulfonioproprionate lyase family protein, partial [Candidatus Pelagibacter sp.]|nr:dimethylsulfonioproprionate lyase family protein [Candidatus Pelagibacter sp.]
TKLPKDLIYNEVQPNYILPAKKLENWQSHSLETMKVHNIIKQLSPYVNWKQTYEEKDVGKAFLEKYGYFELFGPTGHFLTNKMSLFVFFVDAESYYTWHNHEAEELYFVLSGSAKFESKSDESNTLIPLKTRFHKSFQPHSLTTYHEKCLALVIWRDKLNSEIKVVKN